LSPEARAVIERAASAASRYQRELWAARTTTALDAVKELGVEVHTVDQAAFAEVVAPLKEAYRGTRVGELIGAIAGVQAASDGEG
jgi:TRAP-type C4-dicarboxylate transport system substrate-binding protein